jgi:uncharacterized protein HemY
MVDVNGDPDTEEMISHWDAEKRAAADMMDKAANLSTFGGDFTAANRTARINAFKTAHPDCAICQAFAGNRPRPSTADD